MGLKKTTEQFVSELKEIFKNKPFSFDKVVYTGARNYVTVTCNLHGEWRAMATNLQQCKGCRGCRTDKVTDARRKDKEHFVQKSKKIHGDTYDYSDVIYVNNTKNVAIKCKEHGVFVQDIYHHLHRKQGCPKCAVIKQGKIKTDTWIESLEDLVLKIPFGGHVRECFSKEGIEQATRMFKNLSEI